MLTWPFRRWVLTRPEQGRRVVAVRFVPHLVLLVLVGLVVMSSAGWALAAWLGGLGAVSRSPVAARLDMVKIVLSVVAGFGGVVALTVAYRRQKHAEAAEQRADAAEARADAADQRARGAAFNERFGACAEQLGSDKPAIRLAGMYALAQLADDWDTGRQTCIDVLCAYLRMPYDPEPAADDHAQHGVWARERQVRHTGWRLVGTHLRTGATTTSWQGRNFDFTGAAIDGADLHGALFTGNSVVDFRQARFTGEVTLNGVMFACRYVDFTGAHFAGEVMLNGANFMSGVVDFRKATFSAGMVDCHGVRFTDAEVEFDGAEFSGATVNFMGPSFHGGVVSFCEAQFSGGRVGFSRPTFAGGGVQFCGAVFSGTEMHISDALFSGGSVDFREAHFAAGIVEVAKPRGEITQQPQFDDEITPSPTLHVDPSLLP